MGAKTDYTQMDPKYMHPYDPTKEEVKTSLEEMGKALEEWGKVDVRPPQRNFVLYGNESLKDSYDKMIKAEFDARQKD